MNFISFNEHIVKEKINQFSGSEKKKTVVLDDGKTYLLKFPDPSRQANSTLSYINNALSEYIGCKIVESIGIPVQHVILGIYDTGTKHKVACACQDVRGVGENLVEIEKMLLSDLDSKSSKATQLSDICSFMQNNHYIDAAEITAFYYRQFVIDALIGNTDRHNGNWGVIESADGTYHMSPIFDCGSSLSPLISDDSINETTVTQAALGTTSTISDENGRIIYKRFFETSCDPNFLSALNDLAFLIDIKKIHGIINEIPSDYISEKRRQFYHDVLQKKYDKIFIPAFKRCLTPEINDISSVPEEVRMESEALVELLKQADIGERLDVNVCGTDLFVRKISAKQALVMDQDGNISFTPFQTEHSSNQIFAATVSLMISDGIQYEDTQH